jgi:hypothetical protein
VTQGVGLEFKPQYHQKKESEKSMGSQSKFLGCSLSDRPVIEERITEMPPFKAFEKSKVINQQMR